VNRKACQEKTDVSGAKMKNFFSESRNWLANRKTRARSAQRQLSFAVPLLLTGVWRVEFDSPRRPAGILAMSTPL
jgi:hypothetical protein